MRSCDIASQSKISDDNFLNENMSQKSVAWNFSGRRCLKHEYLKLRHFTEEELKSLWNCCWYANHMNVFFMSEHRTRALFFARRLTGLFVFITRILIITQAKFLSIKKAISAIELRSYCLTLGGEHVLAMQSVVSFHNATKCEHRCDVIRWHQRRKTTPNNTLDVQACDDDMQM